MKSIDIPRRDFLKYSFATTLSFASLLDAYEYREDQKRDLRSFHVVVVGGGFGGATTAKYLKKYNKEIRVSLIEPDEIYTTMPKGNCYISHIIGIENLMQNYKKLASDYGVEIIKERVQKIDADAKRVVLKSGKKIFYDKIVLSVGIDFDYSKIEGYQENITKSIPHAWRSKEQLEILHREIESMRDGGLFVVAPPPNPYRCPPGPYERASLIAEYFKAHKPKSKIIILDSKESFCKEPLFKQGWKKLYGDMIEWVPLHECGKIVSVDAKRKIVTTEKDLKIEADVLNIIPPQKAGKLIFETELADESGWAPVNQQSFESSLKKDVYIVGDSAIAGDMPKSGHSANSQGKLCAASIVLSLRGERMISPKLANTCYSLIGRDYGINVIDIYQFNGKKMAAIKGAGGITPLKRDDSFYMAEAYYAKAWHKSITHDIWG